MFDPTRGEVALIDAATGEGLTYRELGARVVAASARLRAAAGPAGIAVGFVGNDLASVLDYLGALAAGVPIVLLDRRLDDALAGPLLARYRPEVVLGRAYAGPAGGTAPHPDLAVLLSTSGSTGSPKLVRLSRAALEANARAIAQVLAIGPGEVAPTSLPLPYAYGLSVLNSHLIAGATVVLTEDGLLSDGFWRACRDHGVTSLAGVPHSYQLLRRLDLDRIAPRSLRTFTQAGGRMDPALIRQAHERAHARDGRLYVMYGQTEATARIAILPPGELPARAGAVGRAVPGGELRIVDDGREVGPGTRGEIVYRGPGVMMGYAEHRDDLARGDDLGGELATGDLGYLDDDGHLWITGRARRSAKVFGLRVNLDELEALLHVAGSATDAPLAAIAGDDRVAIFVESDDPALAPRLRQTASERTGINPAGFVVTTLSQLPRLPSGKVDYRALERT